MGDHIFLSDAHLNSGNGDEYKEEKLLRFLGTITPEEVETLYFLGDLFDFWFEFKHAIFSACFRTLATFSALRDQGITLHLIVGNHDYWAGDFLREKVGFSVYYEPLEMDLEGTRLYLCHGDGLDSADKGYLLLKRIIRSRACIRALRTVHPDLVVGIGRWASTMSRGDKRAASRAKGHAAIREYAKRKFLDGADVFISGHVHEPTEETLEVNGRLKRYFNLGDWEEHFSYVRYRDGQFSLEFFER